MECGAHLLPFAPAIAHASRAIEDRHRLALQRLHGPFSQRCGTVLATRLWPGSLRPPQPEASTW